MAPSKAVNMEPKNAAVIAPPSAVASVVVPHEYSAQPANAADRAPYKPPKTAPASVHTRVLNSRAEILFTGNSKIQSNGDGDIASPQRKSDIDAISQWGTPTMLGKVEPADGNRGQN